MTRFAIVSSTGLRWFRSPSPGGHDADTRQCPLMTQSGHRSNRERVRQTGRSLRLDIRELNYLPKLLDFTGNEFAELGGRVCKSLPALIGKARFEFRVGKGGIDFVIEFFDDLSRRVFGRTKPNPTARLITRHKIGNDGNVRQWFPTRFRAHRQWPQFTRSDVLD